MPDSKTLMRLHIEKSHYRGEHHPIDPEIRIEIEIDREMDFPSNHYMDIEHMTSRK